MDTSTTSTGTTDVPEESTNVLTIIIVVAGTFVLSCAVLPFLILGCSACKKRMRQRSQDDEETSQSWSSSTSSTSSFSKVSLDRRRDRLNKYSQGKKLSHGNRSDQFMTKKHVEQRKDVSSNERHNRLKKYLQEQKLSLGDKFMTKSHHERNKHLLDEEPNDQYQGRGRRYSYNQSHIRNMGRGNTSAVPSRQGKTTGIPTSMTSSNSFKRHQKKWRSNNDINSHSQTDTHDKRARKHVRSQSLSQSGNIQSPERSISFSEPLETVFELVGSSSSASTLNAASLLSEQRSHEPLLLDSDHSYDSNSHFAPKSGSTKKSRQKNIPSRNARYSKGSLSGSSSLDNETKTKGTTSKQIQSRLSSSSNTSPSLDKKQKYGRPWQRSLSSSPRTSSSSESSSHDTEDGDDENMSRSDTTTNAETGSKIEKKRKRSSTHYTQTEDLSLLDMQLPSTNSQSLFEQTDNSPTQKAKVKDEEAPFSVHTQADDSSAQKANDKDEATLTESPTKKKLSDMETDRLQLPQEPRESTSENTQSPDKFVSFYARPSDKPTTQPRSKSHHTLRNPTRTKKLSQQHRSNSMPSRTSEKLLYKSFKAQAIEKLALSLQAQLLSTEESSIDLDQPHLMNSTMPLDAHNYKNDSLPKFGPPSYSNEKRQMVQPHYVYGTYPSPKSLPFNSPEMAPRKRSLSKSKENWENIPISDYHLDQVDSQPSTADLTSVDFQEISGTFGYPRGVVTKPETPRRASAMISQEKEDLQRSSRSIPVKSPGRKPRRKPLHYQIIDETATAVQRSQASSGLHEVGIPRDTLGYPKSNVTKGASDVRSQSLAVTSPFLPQLPETESDMDSQSTTFQLPKESGVLNSAPATALSDYKRTAQLPRLTGSQTMTSQLPGASGVHLRRHSTKQPALTPTLSDYKRTPKLSEVASEDSNTTIQTVLAPLLADYKRTQQLSKVASEDSQTSAQPVLAPVLADYNRTRQLSKVASEVHSQTMAQPVLAPTLPDYKRPPRITKVASELHSQITALRHDLAKPAPAPTLSDYKRTPQSSGIESGVHSQITALKDDSARPAPAPISQLLGPDMTSKHAITRPAALASSEQPGTSLGAGSKSMSLIKFIETATGELSNSVPITTGEPETLANHETMSPNRPDLLRKVSGEFSRVNSVASTTGEPETVEKHVTMSPTKPELSKKASREFSRINSVASTTGEPETVEKHVTISPTKPKLLRQASRELSRTNSVASTTGEPETEEKHVTISPTKPKLLRQASRELSRTNSVASTTGEPETEEKHVTISPTKPKLLRQASRELSRTNSVASTTGEPETEEKHVTISPTKPKLMRQASREASTTGELETVEKQVTILSPKKPKLSRKASGKFSRINSVASTTGKPKTVEIPRPKLLKRTSRGLSSSATTTGEPKTVAKQVTMSPKQPKFLRKASGELLRVASGGRSQSVISKHRTKSSGVRSKSVALAPNSGLPKTPSDLSFQELILRADELVQRHREKQQSQQSQEIASSDKHNREFTKERQSILKDVSLRDTNTSDTVTKGLSADTIKLPRSHRNKNSLSVKNLDISDSSGNTSRYVVTSKYPEDNDSSDSN